MKGGPIASICTRRESKPATTQFAAWRAYREAESRKLNEELDRRFRRMQEEAENERERTEHLPPWLWHPDPWRGHR